MTDDKIIELQRGFINKRQYHTILLELAGVG